MPTTIITGAAGFTARYITAILRDLGHQVIGMVQRGQSACTNCNGSFVADLLDQNGLAAAFEEFQPDHVVHLAAIAQVNHADVAMMYATNIVGTRNLLDGLRSLTKTPQSILLASSANIYGNIGGIIDEDMIPIPSNDYGVTKLAMESVASIYGDSLPLIISRPFNYTGVGQSEAFLIPKIIAAARRRQRQIMLGNLDVARDFSDVRCVADHYVRLLLEPSAVGETVNVCSGKTTTLRDLIVLVEKLSDNRFEIIFDPKLSRTGEVKCLQGNADKLARLIGPLKSIPLDDTLDWMLSTPNS